MKCSYQNCSNELSTAQTAIKLPIWQCFPAVSGYSWYLNSHLVDRNYSKPSLDSSPRTYLKRFLCIFFLFAVNCWMILTSSTLLLLFNLLAYSVQYSRNIPHWNQEHRDGLVQCCVACSWYYHPCTSGMDVWSEGRKWWLCVGFALEQLESWRCFWRKQGEVQWKSRERKWTE